MNTSSVIYIPLWTTRRKLTRPIRIPIRISEGAVLSQTRNISLNTTTVIVIYTWSSRKCLILKYPSSVQWAGQQIHAAQLQDKHRNWSIHWCAQFLCAEYAHRNGNSSWANGNHQRNPEPGMPRQVDQLVYALLPLSSSYPSTSHIWPVWTTPRPDCCYLMAQ